MSAREIFAFFDSNKDGSISSEELKASMVTMGAHVSDEEVRLAIAFCDTDGNGVLSFEEFEKLISGHPPQQAGPHTSEDLAAIFRAMDKNGDGHISAEELKAAMQMGGNTVTDEEVQQAMKEADTNGDGVINIEELARVMAQH